MSIKVTKMKYIPLNKFPEYDENPFMENAIQEINEHSVKKKVFIKGNKSVLTQVINDNGEIVAHSAFLKTIEVDESQFVKVYLSRFGAFYELNKSSIKVFGYILNKCIIPNKDIFYIDFDEAKAFTGYSANNIIRAGLSCLVQQGIIARSTNPYKYYLNALVFFNGDRITFADSYIKRRKKAIESSTSQLSIWPNEK
jgi:hypothetical protein